MEELIDNVGKWGGIPITDLKNRVLDNYVYPNDLKKIQELVQPIVECIGIDSNFLVLKSESVVFRLDPQIFQACKKPLFFIGDKVNVTNSKGFLEYGIVSNLYWHVSRNMYIYTLEVKGKIKSRRYNESDLDKVD